MMLSDGIVGIPDDALGPYPHPQRAHHARVVAWATEHGLGDQVAWCSILTEETTVEIVKRKEVIHLAGTLAAYKAVYGNRKGKPRRSTRRRRRDEEEVVSLEPLTADETVGALPGQEQRSKRVEGTGAPTTQTHGVGRRGLSARPTLFDAGALDA